MLRISGLPYRWAASLRFVAAMGLLLSLFFSSSLHSQEPQSFNCTFCDGISELTKHRVDTIPLPDFPGCSVVVGSTVYRCNKLLYDIEPMGPYEEMIGNCDSLKNWLAANPSLGYNLNTERLRWLEDYGIGQIILRIMAEDADSNKAKYLCPLGDVLDCGDVSLACFRVKKKLCWRFMAPIPSQPLGLDIPTKIRTVRNCGQGCCITQFRGCWDATSNSPQIKTCTKVELTDIGCSSNYVGSPLPPGYKWVSSCYNACQQIDYYYKGPPTQ